MDLRWCRRTTTGNVSIESEKESTAKGSSEPSKHGSPELLSCKERFGSCYLNRKAGNTNAPMHIAAVSLHRQEDEQRLLALQKLLILQYMKGTIFWIMQTSCQAVYAIDIRQIKRCIILREFDEYKKWWVWGEWFEVNLFCCLVGIEKVDSKVFWHQTAPVQITLASAVTKR